jgi:hypothetical protein
MNIFATKQRQHRRYVMTVAIVSCAMKLASRANTERLSIGSPLQHQIPVLTDDVLAEAAPRLA